MPDPQKTAEVESKEKVKEPEKLADLIRDFFENFSKMTPRERMKQIGRILVIATFGKYIGEKETQDLVEKGNEKAEDGEEQSPPVEQKEEAASDKKREKDNGKQEMDPHLSEGAPEGTKPQCRKTKDAKRIMEDHQHNARMLEVASKNTSELKSVVAHYRSNKSRYEKVARATGIPGMLICAIHYREGFDFDRYLHNGQKLGKPTTIVPKGFLFKEGQWEEAAIHALGGNIKDLNGKPSLKAFRRLRDQFGLTADSKDIGAMMAFAEYYNGLGYRNRGIRSCYVYAGTNLNQAGRFVADHKFDPESIDQRLGVAAIIMGIQAEEAGQTPKTSDDLKLVA